MIFNNLSGSSSKVEVKLAKVELSTNPLATAMLYGNSIVRVPLMSYTVPLAARASFSSFTLSARDCFSAWSKTTPNVRMRKQAAATYNTQIEMATGRKDSGRRQ